MNNLNTYLFITIMVVISFLPVKVLAQNNGLEKTLGVENVTELNGPTSWETIGNTFY